MNRNLVYLFVITCFLAFFSCQKEYSFEKGNTIPAEGSLWDSSGDCLPSTVHGTYYNGVTPGGDTAYVELQVNVTKTGGYNIKTDTANGFSFSDSGYFSNTGVNTIQLKPSGHPILVGTSTFNVSFDSTVCSFAINVQDSTGTGLGGIDTTGNSDTSQVQAGTWKFTQGSLTFTGTIDTSSKDNSSGVATILLVAGSTATKDTILSLNFLIAASDIQPGTYTSAKNGVVFNFIDATSIISPIYTASLLDAGTDFAIVVTSYDAITKEMKGTFSGHVLTSSGAVVPITNGIIDIFFP
ncbi:hypothetical protein [Parafilimonas terrae]|uniref:Uncharacterized protein n=1 Tax=Parafilimonas terrae TaxID=1465490 RepID=A0A1I5WDZ8_9BACT|nr:hypothetical protein [Parafilimonas terrae]SFQ17576.1 hypothetical protein SAMN05444277_106104 [Parafilimonas terrae]